MTGSIWTGAGEEEARARKCHRDRCPLVGHDPPHHHNGRDGDAHGGHIDAYIYPPYHHIDHHYLIIIFILKTYLL